MIQPRLVSESPCSFFNICFYRNSLWVMYQAVYPCASSTLQIPVLSCPLDPAVKAEFLSLSKRRTNSSTYLSGNIFVPLYFYNLYYITYSNLTSIFPLLWDIGLARQNNNWISPSHGRTRVPTKYLLYLQISWIFHNLTVVTLIVVGLRVVECSCELSPSSSPFFGRRNTDLAWWNFFFVQGGEYEETILPCKSSIASLIYYFFWWFGPSEETIAVPRICGLRQFFRSRRRVLGGILQLVVVPPNTTTKAPMGDATRLSLRVGAESCI